MDPLELLPSQIAQQRTQDYFGGPWYKKMLAGLAEGLKATGKDYESPYDRFFKQSLAEYQAQTPRLASEQRALTAENLLKSKLEQENKKLEYQREKDKAANALKKRSIDVDETYKKALAGDKESLTKWREKWQGLTGDAALKNQATINPAFGEAYEAEMGRLDSQKATIDALEKMASTPDKMGTLPRFTVRDNLNEFGVPVRETIQTPGSPGISREATRRQGMAGLQSFGRKSATADINPLMQTLEEFKTQKPEPMKAPGTVPPVTVAPPTPEAEAVYGKPVPQEAVKLGKADIVLPAIQLPKAMQPTIPFRNRGDVDAFNNKRDTISNTNEAASLMINLFVKGQLGDISGPLAGSEIAKKLRAMGWLDPSTGQFALGNTFLDQWKKKMYSETGMQANAIELATAQEYFANLGNSPEANLKKTIFMALASRSLLEKAKLPGNLRNEKIVDLSSGLIAKTDQIVKELQSGMSFNPRSFDMRPYVWQRYELPIPQKQAKPKAPEFPNPLLQR